MARSTTGRKPRKVGKKATTKLRTAANVRNAKKNPRVASPLREVLAHMTGKNPPRFVRGYSLDELSDEEYEQLHTWAVKNVRPRWLTGCGLLEAAEDQVQDAVSNGNILPSPDSLSGRVEAAQRVLRRLRQRYDAALLDLAVAVEGQARRTQHDCNCKAMG